MSFSNSIDACNMMESVALNESRVIVEDLDYVLVETSTQNNDAMDVDDDSYDYCEDAVSMLSVEHHSSLSVCSDLPSIDPSSFGLEEEVKPERRPRVISFGNDDDEVRTRTGKFESSVEPLDEQMTEVEETIQPVDTPVALEPPKEEEKELSEAEERIETIAETAMEEMQTALLTTRRLSNKKRRKKMKLMKRAAAAAAAAAALSEMTAYVPTAPTLPPSPKRSSRNKAKTSRPKKSTSVAVACATETMESYRRELADKKKGSSKFVSPL